MTRDDANRSHSIVLLLLFFGGLINYMDRAVMGVLAPLIRHDLELSASDFGLAFGVFSVGYGVFTVVGGWAADRFGARPVLGISMFVWSALCGITGLVNGMWSLLIVRTAFGAGESPWVPASNKMLASLVPPERFGTVLGISSAGQPIGGAVAGPLIAFTALGWRWAFGMVALIGIAWSVTWWLLTARYSSRQRTLVHSSSPRQEGAAVTSCQSANLILRDPAILATCYSIMAVTYVQTFFLSWFPSYLTSARGLVQSDMALVTGIPWILGAVGFACGGLLSDFAARTTRGSLLGRKIVLTGCLVPASLFIMLVPVVESARLAIGLMSGAIGLLYLAGPNYFATIHQAAPPRYFGSAIGFMALCSTLAGFLSPTVTGYLIQRTDSFATSFSVTAVVLLSAVLTFNVLAVLPKPGGSDYLDTPVPAP